ncbi:MAG TPA: YneF family protein [Bacilli bacterium]|nr:YneF family protein [Bacilli bacterium]
MQFLIDVLQILGGVIAGGIAGFFLAKKYLMKYMKKNPPINEQMIRAMMTSMGRTPSQKQVNQTMKQMTKYMD